MTAAYSSTLQVSSTDAVVGQTLTLSGTAGTAGAYEFVTVEAMAEDRPDDLARAYATALKVGPRWREHIGNSLKRMPKTKDIIDTLVT